MGRPRSPSPGNYRSHKKARYDDDRYDRDGRGGRRRSRSRSPDRRYRDHDSRRWDDDRRDDAYRPARRHSRERRRSRDRSQDRHRRHSRDRTHQSRRDSSVDSKPRSRRDDSRERDGKSAKPDPAPSTGPSQAEEQKKAERLARLEAWKSKQAEKEKQQKVDAAASGQQPANGSAYPGKFDPKAVMKKATSTSDAPLGGDVLVPTNTMSASKAQANGKNADLKPPAGKNVKPAATGHISGFGFGNKPIDGDRPSKKGIALDDEESTKRKLEKLPSPPPTDAGNNDAANVVDDEDDGEDLHEGNNEEGAAAAARAAAEKRGERLQNGAMDIDAPVANESTKNASADAMDVDDDVDPLDAFMNNLGDSAPARPTLSSTLGSRAKTKQRDTNFGDDDEVEPIVDDDPDDILAMAAKARKKKDIPTVNHAKADYEPFRKKFYVEPLEFANMDEDDVTMLRESLDGIKIRGVDVPKPVQKWAQCGMGQQTLEVIRKLNYEAPTSIQAQAIPAIMSGRDVIGVAKTGSGKTIAFLLPMFRHIKDQRPLESLDGPVGLVMAPTRELATQIYKECKPFLKALNLRAVCAYGGAPIKDQIADLKRGAEIVVCTPGRMIDLLAANSGRVTNLHRVTYVVLDEADRMFDMGFEPQIMKIMSNIRPDKQTVLFSATFPRQMEALARKVLQKPVEIVVGGRSVVAPEITQLVEVRPEESKFLRLLELLGTLYNQDEDARTLVFVDRQEAADSLLRDLMRKGYPCMSIHGGKDQVDRNSTIDDFKAGVIPILIATSVAARGLDVKQLKLVVNFDCPNHLEDYVHRAGRTGRAGNKGTAVTFITEDQERYAGDIAKALRQSGQPVPDQLQKLVDNFAEKVKAGKEKANGSGFGGKGLEKLDQERDAARNRERKTYNTGDDHEEEKQETSKGDDDFALAPVVSSSSMPGVPKGIDLDGKITVHKKDGNPLDRVAQATADIHSRLNKTGQLRSGVPIDNKGPDAGAFHATLEINDFPQKARWAVTNRTNVAKILDATGTSITTKGSFYPAGKNPEPGKDPKLYILVEGDTELAVTNAMRELMRLLKEGTAAAVDNERAAPASGRYNVL